MLIYEIFLFFISGGYCFADRILNYFDYNAGVRYL